jgi:hypothetical protein
MTADDGFPLYVPDTNDESDFPHSILKPQDSDASSDHPTMGDPAPGVVDTFYGIQDQAVEGFAAEGASSLVEVEDPEGAAEQDARFTKSLVTIVASARSFQARSVMVSGAGVPMRLVRENRYRGSVTILNPPAPVGDGASVIWIAEAQADAKVGIGFPLVAGSFISLPASCDVWAVSSNAAGSIASILAPVYVESLQ